jgi:RHS repeat-associated protein
LLGGARSRTFTNGLLTGFNETLPGVSRASTLTYETTGRIASETTAGLTTVFGYDAGSQLISATPSTGTPSLWTYDALGRRVTDKVGTATTKYVYDAGGQLCWSTTGTLSPAASCALAPASAAKFTWDPAGRLLSEVRTATNKVNYTYDAQGRMASAVRVNGTTTSTSARGYGVDGMLTSLNNTVVTTTATTVTTNLFDWDPFTGGVAQLTGITNTAGAVTDLVYGPTGFVGAHAAALNPVGVAQDVYGSMIPSTGNTLARNAAYTPFGTAAGANTFEPRIGYRGELTIDNQLYLRARNYQTSLGRFTTRDPAPGRPGTTTFSDPYHYGDNNPLNRVDPTGRLTSQSSTDGLRPGERVTYGSAAEREALAEHLLGLGDLQADVLDGVFRGGAQFEIDLALDWAEQGKEILRTEGEEGRWFGLKVLMDSAAKLDAVIAGLQAQQINGYHFHYSDEYMDSLIAGLGGVPADRAHEELVQVAVYTSNANVAMAIAAGLIAQTQLNSIAARGMIQTATTAKVLSGSGPVPGVLEASPRAQSVGAIKSWNGKPVEFVFDPESGTFAMGRPAASAGLKGSPHQQLVAAIDGNPSTVVGGIVQRGENGLLTFDEMSGHYWQNWTPEVRQQFIDTMAGYGVPVG